MCDVEISMLLVWLLKKIGFYKFKSSNLLLGGPIFSASDKNVCTVRTIVIVQLRAHSSALPASSSAAEVEESALLLLSSVFKSTSTFTLSPSDEVELSADVLLAAVSFTVTVAF